MELSRMEGLGARAAVASRCVQRSGRCLCSSSAGRAAGGQTAPGSGEQQAAHLAGSAQPRQITGEARGQSAHAQSSAQERHAPSPPNLQLSIEQRQRRQQQQHQWLRASRDGGRVSGRGVRQHAGRARGWLSVPTGRQAQSAEPGIECRGWGEVASHAHRMWHVRASSCTARNLQAAASLPI